MLKYYLYQLEFLTPVHFGDAAEGGDLSAVSLEFGADALFSAICTELARQGEEQLIEALVQQVQEGRLRFSDLFPCRPEDEALYLPKPVLPPQRELAKQAVSLQEDRKLATRLKEQKNAKYLRVAELGLYYAAHRAGKPLKLEGCQPAQLLVNTRVNKRGDEPLPYSVGAYVLNKGWGLYGVLLAEEETAARLEQLFALLGQSGIGGKRSSGYGKFQLFGEMFFELGEAAGDTGEYDDLSDAETLLALLKADQEELQLSIASLLPAPAEVEVVSRGTYQLKQRSGFAGGVKRDSVHMLTAGSCLPERIAGRLIDLGEQDGHPVWRYGCGLFVGLK